jgi:hypothetical protein
VQDGRLRIEKVDDHSISGDLSLKGAAEVAYKKLHGTEFRVDLDKIHRSTASRIRGMMRQIVAYGFAHGIQWPIDSIQPIDRAICRNLIVLNDVGDLAMDGEHDPLITGTIVKQADLERFIQLVGGSI